MFDAAAHQNGYKWWTPDSNTPRKAGQILSGRAKAAQNTAQWVCLMPTGRFLAAAL
jgi:hypothetical protein